MFGPWKWLHQQEPLLLWTNCSEGAGASPPAIAPYPVPVTLSQGALWRSLSGQRLTPAQGARVARHGEILDPGDKGRTLEVPRPQLQGVASLGGQDHHAPRERCSKSDTPQLHASRPDVVDSPLRT